MGDADKADAAMIVDCSWHNETQKWPHRHAVYHVKANYMLLVDNLMDLTHLGTVHKSTIGGNARAHVEADMKVTPSDTGLHFIRWLADTVPPPSFRKAADFEGNVDRWMEFEFIAPASIVQWSGALDVGRDARRNRDQDGGFSARLFHGLTPETETTSHYFWSTANGYRQHDPEATATLFNEIAHAFNEDKHVIEQQQIALARHGEEGLVDTVSDVARVHMRRIAQRMCAAEAVEAPR
jgi:vanillate O-demethylase monooxygenase subunit